MSSETPEGGTATADEAGGKGIKTWNLMTSILGGMKSNDLKSLKAYFDSDQCDINDYVQALDYSYNVTPRIFKKDKDGKSYRQVSPNNSYEALGFSGEDSGNSLYSAFMDTDTFSLELAADARA